MDTKSTTFPEIGLEGEMGLQRVICGLIAAIILASVGAGAQSGQPGDCPNDSKLLNDGPNEVGTSMSNVTEP